MKKLLYLFIAIFFIGFFIQSCTEDETNYEIQKMSESDIRKDSIIVPPGG